MGESIVNAEVMSPRAVVLEKLKDLRHTYPDGTYAIHFCVYYRRHGSAEEYCVFAHSLIDALAFYRLCRNDILRTSAFPTVQCVGLYKILKDGTLELRQSNCK